MRTHAPTAYLNHEESEALVLPIGQRERQGRHPGHAHQVVLVHQLLHVQRVGVALQSLRAWVGGWSGYGFIMFVG